MATFKNLLLYINGVPPVARTHDARMDADMTRIKHRVCRACELSSGAYDEAHYDLAESWFVYHDYLEYTAKVFMVSKTYHRWWTQQITALEEEFLHRQESQNLNPCQLREAMFEAIITMNIHPSAELRRRMHQEGTSAIRANPELSRLKIYRYV